ncbi:MAG: LrgB family protein [Lachnospiraceae bacterium]|nr:LrgB family protein [Lachnospiraceae bacterium]
MEIVSNPLFGVVLSILTFWFAKWIGGKLKWSVLNPLLLAIIFCIVILKVFQIPLESYQVGGDMISMFLGPATAVLAYSIYRQFALLKKYLIPVVCGCLAGSITSMLSAWILCDLFGLDESLKASMLPKSVTTPIAIGISEQLGGIPSVTVAIVIVTGILGSVLCPVLLKIFRIQNSIAAGIAIGTCSHAVGTTKAVELGEVEGAMSGIAIGVSGILTVLLSLLL